MSFKPCGKSAGHVRLALPLMVALTVVTTAASPVWAENAAASWTHTTQRFGIPARAVGTIHFRLDPQAGKFTCTLTGTGSMSGQAVVFGVVQQITANITFSQSACAGTYFPKEGTISGNITVTGTYQSSATYTDSEGETRTERSNDAETYAGSIFGDLGRRGGTGQIDAQKMGVTWTTTDAAGTAAGAAASASVLSDKEVVKLANELMAGFDKSAAQGAGFSAYLREQVGDPAAREQVYQAVVKELLAEIKKENRTLDKQLAAPKKQTKAVNKVNEATAELAEVEDAGDRAFKQGIVDAGTDKLKEFGWGWAKDKLPEATATVIDGVAGAVDAANTIKENIEEIRKTQAQFEKLTEQAKKGELERGQAEALKGGALIGHGLKSFLPEIPGVKSTVTRIWDGAMTKAANIAQYFAFSNKTTDVDNINFNDVDKALAGRAALRNRED